MARSVEIKKQILSTKERVIPMLREKPQLRDCDEKLVANVWFNELKALKIDPSKITALEFLRIYGEGKLTDAELIARSRRKAQEEIIEIRGDGWNDKHGISEDLAKQLGREK